VNSEIEVVDNLKDHFSTDETCNPDERSEEGARNQLRITLIQTALEYNSLSVQPYNHITI
jgi:hypothetical protein